MKTLCTHEGKWEPHYISCVICGRHITRRKHIPMFTEVKKYLRTCFAMKDLGETAYELSVKIYRIDLRSSSF